MVNMEKQPVSEAWLDSELENLIRDFGVHRILAALGRVTVPHVADHTDELMQAFAVLDKEHGGHNVVSICEMRRCITMDRKSFDSALHRLFSGNKLCTVPTNPCYKVDQEEREASFKVGAERILFVSRVHLPPKVNGRPDKLHDDAHSIDLKKTAAAREVETSLVR